MQHEFITAFSKYVSHQFVYILVCVAEPSLWLAYTIYSCTIVYSLYSVSLVAFPSFVLSFEFVQVCFQGRARL
jgi:hypothetical protein